MSTNECCIKPEITDLDRKIAKFYDILGHEFYLNLTRYYNDASLGIKNDEFCDPINTVMDLNSLLTLLIIIYYERKEDAEADTDCGQDLGSAYYYEKYNMECIKMHFQCCDIDITNLLNAFELFSKNVVERGIDFMSLEIQNGTAPCNVSPLFIVK